MKNLLMLIALLMLSIQNINSQNITTIKIGTNVDTVFKIYTVDTIPIIVMTEKIFLNLYNDSKDLEEMVVIYDDLMNNYDETEKQYIKKIKLKDKQIDELLQKIKDDKNIIKDLNKLYDDNNELYKDLSEEHKKLIKKYKLLKIYSKVGLLSGVTIIIALLLIL